MSEREGECPPGIYERHRGFLNGDEAGAPLAGLATYGVCATCGFPRLLERDLTAKVDPGSIKLVWLSPNVCPKCTEVAQRAPEIFAWVVNALDTERRAKT